MLVDISVVLPVYNGELYLKKAIDSILNQTFFNFELIIINDGSTDNSLTIINSYNDPRIVVINQTQKGLSLTLKDTIHKCKGEFIARMDQDDISIFNRLEVQYKYLKLNFNVSVVSNSVAFIDEDDNYLGRSFAPTNAKVISFLLFNEGCVINHPSVMFRKLDYYKTEGYCPEVGDILTDYYLWISFLNNGLKVHNTKNILLKYRIQQASLSSNFVLSSNQKALLSKLFYISGNNINIKYKIKNLVQSAKSNNVHNYNIRKLQTNNILNNLFNILTKILSYNLAETCIIQSKNIYLLVIKIF
jgi:glycosyltransferase involved in cell wall biosynthesis